MSLAAAGWAARESQLLVLGSRGLGGFEGWLLGSVSLVVIAHATVPVVLVRAGAEPPVQGRGGPVVVGIGLVTHAAVHHVRCPVAVIPHS
ncbi:hypothetical protein GCM10020000_04860 [Streptomyces olivoverticillatus]